jgi:hypothetical protein
MHFYSHSKAVFNGENPATPLATTVGPGEDVRILVCWQHRGEDLDVLTFEPPKI